MQSMLVEVEVETGIELQRLSEIGFKSHGIVFWKDSIIALDSDNSALMRIDTELGTVTHLWAHDDHNYYLKGLCIIDDIAFFGMAQQQDRQDRDSPDLDCELAAFDLKKGLLLWRRLLPTHGLLNIVAAPHLAVESTTFALSIDGKLGYRHTKGWFTVYCLLSSICFRA